MVAAVMDRYRSEATPPINGGRDRFDECGTVEAEDVSFLVAPIGMELQPETRLPFRTAADVASAVPEQVDWIVPGFVAPGVVTELDGKLKASGKTTFIGALTRAALTGGQFLNYTVKPSKAIWLTEERAATFVETLKRARLDDRTDLEVLHWHEAKDQPWPAVMAGAIDRAKQIGASIIIVDTISQWGGLRGGAENSNGAQLDAAAPLQEAAAHGLAVIVARHERKAGGDVGDSGRGGSAFSGAVDIVVATCSATRQACRSATSSARGRRPC
jgi:AAA domain